MFSPTKYAEARAMAQAYIEKKYGTGEITLYRGVDGDIGKKLKSEVEGAGKKQIQIKEDVLSGYTDKLSIAVDRGKSDGGITIERKVKTKDILFPPEFLRVKAFEHEREFIVRNTKETRKIKRKEII